MMGEAVSAIQKFKATEDATPEARLAALEEKDRKRYIRETQEGEARQVDANFRGGVAYTNLMMAAGYAGGFWLWGHTRHYLDYKSDVVVALLLLFSLLVFLLWNVAQMALQHWTVLQWQAILKPQIDDYEELRAAYRDRDLKLARVRVRLVRWWLWTLVLTIVPMAIAAAILFQALVAYLFQ